MSLLYTRSATSFWCNKSYQLDEQYYFIAIVRGTGLKWVGNVDELEGMPFSNFLQPEEFCQQILPRLVQKVLLLCKVLPLAFMGVQSSFLST